MIQNFTGPFNVILKSLKAITGKDITIAVQKDNGQLAIKEAPIGIQPIFRNPKILDSQVKYFEKILDFAKINNIKIVLITPPSSKEELNNYSENEIKDFDKFIKSYLNKYDNLSYFNYSNSPDFTLNNFIDMTHLNADGADKFTKILDNDLKRILN